jgi:hypothetical protein
MGATAEEIQLQPDNWRASMLWQRRWICDPSQLHTIKVFAFRSVARNAVSGYLKYGVPAVEGWKEDLPLARAVGARAADPPVDSILQGRLTAAEVRPKFS